MIGALQDDGIPFDCYRNQMTPSVLKGEAHTAAIVNEHLLNTIIINF